MFQAILCTMLLAGQALAADPIKNSTAAEYALHRIERLVILHRLDPSFQANLAGMGIAINTPPGSGDATFVIHAFQVAGADGTKRSVDMNFDLAGHPLTHVVNDGAEAQSAPAWPIKDAVTLAENALHWLEAQGPVEAELKAYFESMTSLTISPELDSHDALVAARVLIGLSDPQASVLSVRMTLEGFFDYFEFRAPQPMADPTYASIKRLIFDVRCVKCHGPTGQTARIPLAPLADLLASPRELVLPGDSADSGLVVAITRTDDKRMPPPAEGAPLTQAQIATIVRWIDQGAKP